MKKLFQKILTCALAVTLAAAVPAQAAQSAAIGGKTAKIVSIPMDGSCVGRVVTAAGTIHNTQSADALIKSAAGSGETVAAAINGMFFNSYYDTKAAVTFPDNCPIILTNLVQDGKTIACGGEQNCIGFTRDGHVKIDRVNAAPQAMVDGRGPVKIWSVNSRNTAPDAVYLITDAVTLPYAMAADATAALIENGVVTKMVYGGAVTLSRGQNLLIFNAGAAASHAGWKLLPAQGDAVTISTALTAQNGGDWSDMTSIAGGGRMLVHNGAVVSADAGYNSALDKDPKQTAASALQRSFAAVKADGTLLLGTVVGSFNDIAAYLQSVGATDAVSLDGGASSMLYENGTYVTRAGRNLASVIVLTRAGGAPAAPAVTAKASALPATVDGKPFTFDAYNIKKNNYFKLRDFAMAVSGTDKQFNVAWDAAAQGVTLTSGSPYTPVGGEFSASAGGAVPPVPTTSPVYLDGTAVSLTAYNINKNNYFKLRDLCRAFDICVRFDSATGGVVIDTQASYTD